MRMKHKRAQAGDRHAPCGLPEAGDCEEADAGDSGPAHLCIAERVGKRGSQRRSDPRIKEQVMIGTPDELVESVRKAVRNPGNGQGIGISNEEARAAIVATLKGIGPAQKTTWASQVRHRIDRLLAELEAPR